MIERFPLRFLLVVLAGWVNRQQFEVVEYLKEENRVLKAHLCGRRLRLTDTQRRRLAARGHRLGQAIVGAFPALGCKLLQGPGATVFIPRATCQARTSSPLRDR